LVLALFGSAHLTILGLVVLFAAVASLLQRRLGLKVRWLRFAIGTALLCNAAMYYGYLIWHGQLTFPDHLPLELCDASLCLVILSLFTLKKGVFDLAYYWALAGATMALLTPNLWEPFPSLGTIQFFIDHGLIVAVVLYLGWSGLIHPQPWSVLSAMLWLNALAVFVGAFDYFFKAD
jgi:hypothetical integral membrane protein (TIGR02206 family)